MDKRMLQKTFREYKKTAKTDFAITAPDSLGDCQSCVWSSLVDKYGDDCHGIWAKHWRHGMNASRDISREDNIYIAHDLTDEQAKVFYKVFSENYNILPREYTQSKCFRLYEKNTEVYEVTYEGDFGVATNEYTTREKASEWEDYMIRHGYKNVQMRRAF